MLQIRIIAHQPPAAPTHGFEGFTRQRRSSRPGCREVNVLGVVETMRYVRGQRPQQPRKRSCGELTQIDDFGDVEPSGRLDVIEAQADDLEPVVRPPLRQRYVVLVLTPTGLLPGLTGKRLRRASCRWRLRAIR